MELREKVAKFPKVQGVYLMRNAEGEVVYVGKAKDLRARIRSYFGGSDERLQVETLLQKVTDIETIITENENQAFILERDLITKFKPRYNIRLKDDKAYLNVRIDMNAEWPRIELVRRVEEDGAEYFGPFSFSYELRSLIEIIKRVVPLRTCSDTIFYNRQRPCLEYQIKRCVAPCCISMERSQYINLVKQAISILQGKTDFVAEDLRKQMESASQDMRFEDAAILRDRISILENTKSNQIVASSLADDRDVFGFYREAALAALTVLRVRNGRIADTHSFSFPEVRVSDEELLEAALSQFYEGGREIPSEILLPMEITNLSLIETGLRSRRGGAIELLIPQRGSKALLLNIAQTNARQHIATTFESERHSVDLMKELARKLKLKQIPRKVECVDISNFQGSDIVGAVVVFVDGEPEKQSYRKYIISFQDKPNDFAAMHEVVTRRLKRGFEEGDLPDLLIIDGGPGQLSKAIAAREELKLNVEIVALAKMKMETKNSRFAKKGEKKPERVYLDGVSVPIILDSSHPVTHLIQRMRDEVHRYVIRFHRNRRSKRVFHSILDDIPGLGPERRSKLLKHFGSIKALAKAEASELSKVGKMPISLAERVRRVVLESMTYHRNTESQKNTR